MNLKEKPRNQTTGALLPQADWKITYYARDAQGNIMATYKMETVTIGGSPAMSFKVGNVSIRHLWH